MRSMRTVTFGKSGHPDILEARVLNNRLIAVSSDGNRLRLWDLSDGVCLETVTMPRDVEHIAFGSAGSIVVAFGSDVAIFDTSWVRTRQWTADRQHPHEGHARLGEAPAVEGDLD
jgi:hypothetical protein